jgi:dTDP-6-deoxy-L-talose 4-dehydrogenase (NAD+)
MKIAIIGGTSFIGQNLIKHLHKKRIEIIATYNSNKPIKNEFSTAWKKLDIRNNKKNYLKYLEYPDIVLNLAWPDIPNYRLKKHFKTFYYQKKFNHNLIKNGLKNLIVLGTCYEYGKINGKISETAKEKPTIPYAISKLKLLRSILELKKNNYFKFAWLRPFFVYGINKKRHTLFSLINRFQKKKVSKLKVCGDLVRDFISINFLCSVITKITKLNKDLGIINVSSGKGILLKDFIKKFLKNKKNFNKIDFNGKNPNNFEPKSFWGDNRKLKKILLNK